MILEKQHPTLFPSVEKVAWLTSGKHKGYI